jgi:hypothetical protein
MKRPANMLLLTVLIATATTGVFAGATTPAPPAAASTNAPSRQIIAYYFHGSVRCRTCQRIELLARETIESAFETDLKANRLVFKAVNYELPENAHFVTDYQLPCPSLVLVRRDNGKDTNGTLLGKTWDLIEDETEFNRYIEAEVNKCLRGATNSSLSAGPAPVP